MTFTTQSSSKPRLKNDTLGKDALIRLYDLYNTLPLATFKEVCEEMVQSGGGNQPTKDSVIFSIRKSSKKDDVLTTTNNFIMAGMGLGV